MRKQCTYGYRCKFHEEAGFQLSTAAYYWLLTKTLQFAVVGLPYYIPTYAVKKGVHVMYFNPNFNISIAVRFAQYMEANVFVIKLFQAMFGILVII
jgi:hypothetical protein